MMTNLLKIEIDGQPVDVVPVSMMGHACALLHFEMSTKRWNDVNSFAIGEEIQEDPETGVVVIYVVWASTKVADAIIEAETQEPAKNKYHFAVINAVFFS